MSYLSTIKNVDKYITSLFVYTNDTGDVWESSFDSIIQAEIDGNINYRFFGDCEDKAQTAIEYAHYKGVPLSCMARCIVDSFPDGDYNKPEGHMVALFYDKDTNEVYYFGDTFGAPCRVSERSHKPKLVNYFEDGQDWIKYDKFKFK